MSVIATQYDLSPHITHDDLTRELIAGRGDLVGALFSEQGNARPLLSWSPNEADLKHPVARRFHAAIAPLCDTNGALSELSLPQLDLGPFSKRLLRLVPSKGGMDFEYTDYGDEIASLFGRNLAGTRVSQIGGHIGLFFMSNYRAVAARRQACMTVHEAPDNVFAQTWTRLVVPVFSHAGHLVEFLVLNIGDSELRPGLDALPLPGIIVQSDGSVIYSNDEAQRVFGKAQLGPKRIQVSQYCDMNIQLGSFEMNLEYAQATTKQFEVSFSNGRIEHFEISVSPLYYKERCFKLVLIRRV